MIEQLEASKYGKRGDPTAPIPSNTIKADVNNTSRFTSYNKWYPCYSLELRGKESLHKIREKISDYFLRSYLASLDSFEFKSEAPSVGAYIKELADCFMGERKTRKSEASDELTTFMGRFHLNHDDFKGFNPTVVDSLRDTFSIQYNEDEEGTVDITYTPKAPGATVSRFLKVPILSSSEEGMQDIEELNKQLATDAFSYAGNELLPIRPAVKLSQPLQFRNQNKDKIIVVENRKPKQKVVFEQCFDTVPVDDRTEPMTFFEAVWGVNPESFHASCPGAGDTKQKFQDLWNKTNSTTNYDHRFQFGGYTYGAAGTVYDHPFYRPGNYKLNSLCKSLDDLSPVKFSWGYEEEKASFQLLSSMFLSLDSSDPRAKPRALVSMRTTSIAQDGFYHSKTYMTGGITEREYVNEIRNCEFADITDFNNRNYAVLDYIRVDDENHILNKHPGNPRSDPALKICSLLAMYHGEDSAVYKKCKDVCKTRAKAAPVTDSSLDFAMTPANSNPATHSFDAGQKIEEARSALNQYKYFKLEFVTEHTAVSNYTDEIKKAFREEIIGTLNLPPELQDRVIINID